MVENRPSKKQQELLSFIKSFIQGNGYGPSYREIMRALDYKSVSTVAVHVDNLIVRGLLRKTDNSARSLEVVSEKELEMIPNDDHITWLQEEIEKRQDSDSERVKKEVAILKEAFLILQKSDKSEE